MTMKDRHREMLYIWRKCIIPGREGTREGGKVKYMDSPLRPPERSVALTVL